MNDQKVNGIVLKSSDYKDDDKLIKLYTLESGKMTVVMRGVKKPKAKMKIPAQVFCFGEYILTGSGVYPVVTGCTVQESFFSLCADPAKFSAAAAVVELTEKAVPDKESNPLLFIQTLKTLKELLKAETDAETRVILLNFNLKLLKICGYNLKLSKCPGCGDTNLTESYFDFSAGGAVCKRCAGIGLKKLSPLTRSIMLMALDCETDRVSTIKPDPGGVEDALSICFKLSEIVFECKLISGIIFN